MTEAEKKYQEVTGEKAVGDTALAVGIVWAVEQAKTLQDRVRIVLEALEAERVDAFKRYEM